MNLKVGDLVFLKNNYPYTDSVNTPIFGGANGRVYGRVIKLVTHFHDSNEHRALVAWSNGHKWPIREEYLQRVTSGNPILVPPSEGLYVLMKPAEKFTGFQIGIAGVDFEPEDSRNNWYSICTKKPLPETVTEESLLAALPGANPEKNTHLGAITAVAHILKSNGFIPAIQPNDVELVPLFQDFSEAINSNPNPGAKGFLIFTLPATELLPDADKNAA